MGPVRVCGALPGMVPVHERRHVAARLLFGITLLMDARLRQLKLRQH